MRLNELVKREQERELQRILQQAKLDKKHLNKGSEWGLNSHAMVSTTANNTNNHASTNNHNDTIANQQFNKSQSTYNLNTNHHHHQLHHQKK